MPPKKLRTLKSGHIVEAIEKDRFDEVEHFVNEGCDVNGAYGEGQHNPLGAAVIYDRYKMATFLLSKGANVHQTHQVYGPPLYLAARMNYNKMLKLLLEKGARTEAMHARDGLTALHVASTMGHNDIVKALLAASANVDVRDTQNAATPLHRATFAGHKSTVLALLQAGADLNAMTISGRTPLVVAAFQGHEKIIAVLAEKGALINLGDDSGTTALHGAVSNGHKGAVRTLLKLGADAEQANYAGTTPREMAQTAGMRKLLDAHLRRKGGAAAAAGTEEAEEDDEDDEPDLQTRRATPEQNAFGGPRQQFSNPNGLLRSEEPMPAWPVTDPFATGGEPVARWPVPTPPLSGNLNASGATSSDSPALPSPTSPVAPAASSSQQYQKANGWLNVWENAKWERRWCVLLGIRFTVFAGRTVDAAGVPTGQNELDKFDIAGLQITGDVNVTPPGFTISLPNGGDVFSRHLSATTLQRAHDWIKVLNANGAHVQNRFLQDLQRDATLRENPNAAPASTTTTTTTTTNSPAPSLYPDLRSALKPGSPAPSAPPDHLPLYPGLPPAPSPSSRVMPSAPPADHYPPPPFPPATTLFPSPSFGGALSGPDMTPRPPASAPTTPMAATPPPTSMRSLPATPTASTTPTTHPLLSPLAPPPSFATPSNAPPQPSTPLSAVPPQPSPPRSALSPWDTLREAIAQQNVPEIERLLRDTASWPAPNKDDASPLFVAVNVGSLRIVELLLTTGGRSVNEVSTKLKRTALHSAAILGRTELVARLLRAGADPSFDDVSGITPLHLAAEAGHMAAVTELLKAGALADEVDDRLFTPAALARAQGHTEIEALLMRTLHQRAVTDAHEDAGKEKEAEAERARALGTAATITPTKAPLKVVLSDTESEDSFSVSDDDAPRKRSKRGPLSTASAVGTSSPIGVPASLGAPGKGGVAGDLEVLRANRSGAVNSVSVLDSALMRLASELSPTEPTEVSPVSPGDLAAVERHVAGIMAARALVLQANETVRTTPPEALLPSMLDARNAARARLSESAQLLGARLAGVHSLDGTRVTRLEAAASSVERAAKSGAVAGDELPEIHNIEEVAALSRRLAFDMHALHTELGAAATRVETAATELRAAMAAERELQERVNETRSIGAQAVASVRAFLKDQAAAVETVARATGMLREVEAEQTALQADRETLDGLLGQYDALRAERKKAQLQVIDLSKEILVNEDAWAPAELADARAALARCEAGNTEIDARLAKLQAAIEEAAGRNHPEYIAFLKGGEKGTMRPRLASSSATVESRNVNDVYASVARIETSARPADHPCRVLVATLHDSRTVVLKAFPRMLMERVAREFALIKSLNHASLVPYRACFQFKESVFLEMDRVPGVTLAEAMSRADGLKPWVTQAVFVQLLHALAYMHDQGVCHGAVAPEHVVLTPTGGIVLVSMRQAARITRFGARTEPAPQTPYSAPELQSTGAPTAAADVFAVGMMLHEVMFGSVPSVAAIADGTVGQSSSSSDLAPLLVGLLKPDPAGRLTAREAVGHAFLTRSHAVEMAANRQIMDSTEKIAMLREYLDQARRQNKNDVVRLQVDRTKIVKTVLGGIASIEPADLFKVLKVRFENENGVDAGGLTSDMYTEFFQRVFEPRYKIFECAQHGDASVAGSTYLPAVAANTPQNLQVFEIFGRILLKSLIDGRAVSLPFPPSFFKFLLEQPVTMRDYEAFDRTAASNLAKVLSAPDVETWCLTYRTDAGTEATVTTATARAYVEAQLRHVLVESRRPQLEAVKRGFNCVPLGAFLRVFNCTDLTLAMCGESAVDAAAVVEALRFHPPEWETSGASPGFLKKFLRQLSDNGLRQFLRLTTSLFTIPYGGFRQHQIIIQQSNRIFAHSCAFSLELMECATYEELHERLFFVLAHVEESGFGEK